MNQSNYKDITFELNDKKFISIINKIVNIYQESKSYYDLEEYQKSYYNLVLASNLVNILQKSKLYSSLNNHKLRSTLLDFNEKIELITQKSKNKMTKYYKDSLNQLISSHIKNELDQFILLNIKINNLDDNRHHLLLTTPDQVLKKVLIKYIVQNCQLIDNLTIIEQDYKPNILKESNKLHDINNKKILIVYNNIDLADESFLEQINKISNPQISFIFLCSQSSKVNSKFLNHFFEEIDIQLPSLTEIINYIRFRVINYLSYKEILDNQYSIDILQIEKLKNIAEKMFQLKLDYTKVDHLINLFLKSSFNISLKNNLFSPIKLKKDHYALINCNSIIKNNIRSKILKPNQQQPNFLFKIPTCKNIIIDNQNYIHVHFCSLNNLSFEDYNLKNIYILEEDINKAKGKINIIGTLNIPIKSESINKDFDTQMELSKLVINLYLHLFKVVVSKLKDNKNQIDSRYDCLNNLDQLKYLIDKYNLSLINLENITQFSDDQAKVIFSVLDNYFKDTQDIKNSNIEQSFNHIFSQNYYTYLLNIENLETKIYFSYGDHIEHLYLSKDINIAESIRNIIQKLYNKDSTVEIVKNINYYLLNIEILENGDLSELKIYLNEKKIDSFSGVPVIDNSFDIPHYYCFTNENDIQLITERFPEDYSTIYYEDESTWKFVPVKLQHQQFLKDNYCLRSRFYLNILNFLLLFQKYNDSSLNQENIVKLENLVFDIQMIIDSIIYKTSEFDNSDLDNNDHNNNEPDNQNVEYNFNSQDSKLDSNLETKINNHKVKNLIWNDLWYRSDNLKITNDDEDEEDYNFQKYKVKLQKKYYINLMLIKNILKILGNNQNIFNYYQSFKNKLFNYVNNQEVLIKGSIILRENQDNIYCNYQIDNFESIIKNNNFLTNLIHKLSSRNNLYFQMFNNIDYLIVKNHNDYISYKINKHNSINDLKPIGQNIIKNENYNSLLQLNTSNNSIIITKWITSFILSSILSESKSFDFCNIFIASLIYNNYFSNNNNDLNICELIDIEPYLQHIINKINYIYSINDAIYEINYKPVFQVIPEKKIQFLYCSKKEIDDNLKILEQHNFIPKNINSSIINCNLKEEYFEDIIENYC